MQLTVFLFKMHAWKTVKLECAKYIKKCSQMAQLMLQKIQWYEGNRKYKNIENFLFHRCCISMFLCVLHYHKYSIYFYIYFAWYERDFNIFLVASLWLIQQTRHWIRKSRGLKRARTERDDKRAVYLCRCRNLGRGDRVPRDKCMTL